MVIMVGLSLTALICKECGCASLGDDAIIVVDKENPQISN